MPAPLIALAAGITGSTLGALSAPIYSVMSEAVNAKLLPSKYGANRLLRTMLPGPDDMLGAYMNGKITKEQLEEGFNRHNIALGDREVDEWTKVCADWWNAVVASRTPQMNFEQMIYAFYSGIMPEAEWTKHKANFKFNPEQQSMFYNLMYAKFDPGIIVSSMYRGIWSRKDSENRIRKFFGCSLDHAKDIIQTTQFIPPPNDLVRFGVRDVFNSDPNITNPLKEEFNENPDMRDWFRSQGIDVATITVGPDKTKQLDVPMAYWMAHWNLPAPTQAYEMLHRLRPGRIDRYNANIPDLKPFEPSDLNTLLKQADYAKKYRPWLAAISYSVPRLIDIKNMFFDDQFGKKELIEKFQDRGYSPTDASEVADYYEHLKKKKKDEEDEKKLRKAYARMKTAILYSYKQGSISREIAYTGLLQTDMEPDEVNIMLNAIDIEVNSLNAQAVIKMVKHEFFLGLYDGLSAYTYLNQGGISSNRASELVQRWQRELSRPRRIASTTTITEWYSRGLMTLNDLMPRLVNLGWTNADVLLYIEEAQEKLNERKARAMAQQARDKRQQEQAAKQLEKEAQAERNKRITDFYRHSSPTMMKDWFKDGLMTSEMIYNRLTGFMGWTVDDATRFVLALTGGSETNGTHP